MFIFSSRNTPFHKISLLLGFVNAELMEADTDHSNIVSSPCTSSMIAPTSCSVGKGQLVEGVF